MRTVKNNLSITDKVRLDHIHPLTLSLSEDNAYQCGVSPSSVFSMPSLT